MSAATRRIAARQAFLLSGMTGFTSDPATMLEVMRLVYQLIEAEGVA